MKIGGQPRDEEEAEMIHDAIMLAAVQKRFERVAEKAR